MDVDANGDAQDDGPDLRGWGQRCSSLQATRSSPGRSADLIRPAPTARPMVAGCSWPTAASVHLPGISAGLIPAAFHPALNALLMMPAGCIDHRDAFATNAFTLHKFVGGIAGRAWERMACARCGSCSARKLARAAPWTVKEYELGSVGPHPAQGSAQEPVSVAHRSASTLTNTWIRADHRLHLASVSAAQARCSRKRSDQGRDQCVAIVSINRATVRNTRFEHPAGVNGTIVTIANATSVHCSHSHRHRSTNSIGIGIGVVQEPPHTPNASFSDYRCSRNHLLECHHRCKHHTHLQLQNHHTRQSAVNRHEAVAVAIDMCQSGRVRRKTRRPASASASHSCTLLASVQPLATSMNHHLQTSPASVKRHGHLDLGQHPHPAGRLGS